MCLHLCVSQAILPSFLHFFPFAPFFYLFISPYSDLFVFVLFIFILYMPLSFPKVYQRAMDLDGMGCG